MGKKLMRNNTIKMLKNKLNHLNNNRSITIRSIIEINATTPIYIIFFCL